MDIHIDTVVVHITLPQATSDGIVAALQTITNQEKLIMTDLTALQDAVAAATTVDQSAITLLNGIKAQLDAALANGVDQAALQGLSDQLGSATTALAAAVTANTASSDPAPADPTPVDPAPVDPTVPADDTPVDPAV